MMNASITKIKLKQKKHFTPWITRGIKKYSKRKQKLYETILKHGTILKEEKYKTYINTYLIRLSGSQEHLLFETNITV